MAVQQVLVPLALLLGFFLLVVRPQRTRARALATVRSSLEVGREVVTTAGLYATVVEVDGDTVVLAVAPGVRCRYATAAVVRIVEPAPVADGAAAPPAG